MIRRLTPWELRARRADALRGRMVGLSLALLSEPRPDRAPRPGSSSIPGILALGLAVVVVLGEIDISLASILAFGAVLFSKFSEAGVPIWLAVPLRHRWPARLLGALNGVLVARLGLPSLAVTLGTMGAYRGLAFIIGSRDRLHLVRRDLHLDRIDQALRHAAGVLPDLPRARNRRSAS